MKKLIIIILILIILGLYFYTSKTKEILDTAGKFSLDIGKKLYNSVKEKANFDEILNLNPQRDSKEE